RAAHVALDASAGTLRIALRELQASAGGAKAALKATASRERADAPWHLQADMDLVDFDPAPWWPGREDSAWRKGPNRLNAKAGVDLVLPVVKEGAPLLDALPALRGQAGLTLSRSLLAGVPLSAEASLRSGDGGLAVAALKLDAAGNSLKADGRVSTAKSGAADQWDIVLAAPS